VASVQERFFWLGQQRPTLGMPKNFMFFAWPHSLRYLEDSGLWRRIPWTFGTFAVGTLAIAGIPPLSGFKSKDEILAGAYSAGWKTLFAIGLVVALMTAFYMTRALILTFFGSYRGDAETGSHIHESPWIMLGPLVILAIGSAAGVPSTSCTSWSPRCAR
jgi:NADH:ubiquinone oxidoreductase subunit 5 (subunit L)/multisubunit Na+/H+ antiporter MnhA subunit